MKRGDGTVKAMAMSFVVGAISFFTGTIFAPEIQPYIYELKDRLYGCYAPFAEAERERSQALEGETSREQLVRIVELYSLATGCNTPRSAQALLSMASIQCSLAETQDDLASAYRAIHRANTLPGTSFVRAYATLEHCDDQTN